MPSEGDGGIGGHSHLPFTVDPTVLPQQQVTK